MGLIDFGDGINTPTGDTVREALEKLEVAISDTIVDLQAQLASALQQIATLNGVIALRDMTIAELEAIIEDLQNQKVLRFSDGQPLQFSDGAYLELAA